MRLFAAALIVLLALNTTTVFAQATPTPLPSVQYVLASGQPARFDYIIRSGQQQIHILLALLILTVWGMFLFGVMAWLTVLRSKSP
jgi:hypothetical protein